MKKRLASLILSNISILAGCNVPGTISSAERERLLSEVQNKPYIVGFEGLGAGGFADNLVKDLCHDLNFAGCTTAGNPSEHIEIMKKARQSGQKVYIVAHSLGANIALNLIEMCEKQNIDIEAVYLMDITHSTKVHYPAKRVIDLKGTIFYMFRDRKLEPSDLESKKTKLIIKVIEGAHHFDLPDKSKKTIEQDILNPESSYFNGYSPNFKFACQQRESQTPSEIFQDRQGAVWRRGCVSGDYGSSPKKNFQRVFASGTRKYSRTSV